MANSKEKKNANRPKPEPNKPDSTAAPVRHAAPPALCTRDAAMLVERQITTRAIGLRAESYNADERSFEAVVATETPAQVMDWRTWDFVDEVLVADGGEFPRRCPLLDSHNRYQSKDVIGSARNFRREGREWVGRGYFAADDPEVDRIAARVRDGHITDVSIGYEVLAYVDIPARTTQTINGRPYTAGERTLRVTTRWRVLELSVTPIGADRKAKIRTDQPGTSAPNLRMFNMNPRLLSYLRSLMRNPNATEDEARTFMASLRGTERTICNIFDCDPADATATGNIDIAIRALGFNPENPTEPLPTLKRSRRNEDEEEEREDEEEEEREFGDDEEEEMPRKKKKRSRSREAQIRAEAIRDEHARQQRLRDMAGDIVPEVVLNRALNDPTITVERAGVMFMEAVRDTRGVPLSNGAPAIHSRNSRSDYSIEALTAAMMLRGATGCNGGLNDPVKRRFHYNPETGFMGFRDASNDPDWCRAVDRGHELRGLSMVNIACRVLGMNGIQVDPIPSHVIRALMTRANAATTQAYLGIYTQTFGALLLDSYEQTPDTTAAWTIERENPNFLPNERHRITKGGELTRHAKGGEAEDYGLADVTEYTRVFRYSAKTAIDEIDLINDTMFDAQRGATPREMGESAKRLRPNLVYSILLANPNLADGNPLFISGVNLLYEAEMSLESLQRGSTAIATQQENGVNLDLTAKYVIAPSARRFELKEILRSTTVVIAGDTDTVRGSFNALSEEGLTPVTDPRLDNGVTDPETGTRYAGNDEDFYMATAPNRHTIEVTHLRGSGRVPEIRSGVFEPGSGKWGIRFDVKHDLGAKALGRAGLVKLTPDSEST